MKYYFPVFSVLGGVLMLFALAMSVPLAFAYFGGDAALFAYDESIAITFACGALWLAMNLRRMPDGRRDFPLDLNEVENLLASYYATDTWAAIERPRGRGQVHMVVGALSTVLTPADIARVQLAAREHDQVHLHVVEGANHWVHVDAPDALHELLLQGSRDLGR